MEETTSKGGPWSEDQTFYGRKKFHPPLDGDHGPWGGRWQDES